MQAVHDHVVIYASSTSNRSNRCKKGGKPRNAALRYIVENTGLRAVTFRANFSESHGIQLKFPQPTTTESSYSEFMFDCTIFPFERRVLVIVEKLPEEHRAMIRVVYEVINEFEPTIDAIESTLQLQLEELRELQAASEACYAPVLGPQRIADALHNPRFGKNFCIGLNKFYSQHGEMWVDTSFLYSASLDDHTSEKSSLGSASTIPISMCAWTHLHTLCNKEEVWSIFRMPKRKPAIKEPTDDGLPMAVTKFRFDMSGTLAFSSALVALSRHLEYWKAVWFPRWLLKLRTMSNLKDSVVAVPVRLCENGFRWVTVVIDLFLPSFPLGNGIVAPRTTDNELWPALLYKAFAKLKGGYNKLKGFSTVEILSELTGAPCVLVYSPHLGVPGKRKLFRRLEQILPRRRTFPDRMQNGCPDFIAIFPIENNMPEVGNLILDLTKDETENMSSVLLTDANGTLKRTIGELPSASDLTNVIGIVPVSWDSFIGLKPEVWTLLPAVQHIRSSRHIYMDADDGKHLPCLVLAISTATITTIAATGILKRQSASTKSLSASKLEIQIRRSNGETLGLHESCDNSNDFNYQKWNGSQVSTKIATTLSPGEYIVSIRVAGVTVSSSRQPEQEMCRTSILTAETVDANVAQIFRCLDHQMRGFLDVDDLEVLMHRHEQTSMFEPNSTEELRANFIASFGSSVKRTSDSIIQKHGLSVEDLGDVYRFIANQGKHVDQDASQTLQELVWHDLTELLEPQLGDEGIGIERSKSHILFEDITELICSIASDSPLVGCISLPMSASRHLWQDNQQ